MVVADLAIAVSNATPNTAWGSPGFGGASSWSMLAFVAATPLAAAAAAALPPAAVVVEEEEPASSWLLALSLRVFSPTVSLKDSRPFFAESPFFFMKEVNLSILDCDCWAAAGGALAALVEMLMELVLLVPLNCCCCCC